MERVNLWSMCPYSPSFSLTEMCYLKNMKLLELLNITFKLIYYSYLQTSVRQLEIKDFCLYRPAYAGKECTVANSVSYKGIVLYTMCKASQKILIQYFRILQSVTLSTALGSAIQVRLMSNPFK